MKPNHPFRRISLFTFGTCVVSCSLLADPVDLLEGLYLNVDDTSVIRPFETSIDNDRDNIEFSSYNGGLLLYSGVSPSTPSNLDGGIAIMGNPVSIVMTATGSTPDAASFKVWRSSDWSSGIPLFNIDGLTGNSTFTGSNVAINGGSLSVTGNQTVSGTLSAGGSPVITAASAGSVLTGQNFVQLGSGGVLNIISATASTSNTTGAFTVAGGIGIAKDSYINGIKIGKGGGSVSNNTAFGATAIENNTSGTGNTAMGSGALMRNTTGSSNSTFGIDSMQYNTTGVWNTAIGAHALYANNGNFNVGIGFGALYWNTTGSSNTAVGLSAGRRKADGAELTSVSDSIFIGTNSAASANADSNSIVIGSGAVGAGSNTTVLGNGSTTHTYLKGETNSSSLRVTGATLLEGDVVLAEAQGDISMGDYQ